jgi:hypothetical protein
VEVAERFADGQATEQERQAAEHAAGNVHQPTKFQYPDPAGPLDECATQAACVSVSHGSTYENPGYTAGGGFSGLAASLAADAVAYAGILATQVRQGRPPLLRGTPPWSSKLSCSVMSWATLSGP